jgi:hypothetical protein
MLSELWILLEYREPADQNIELFVKEIIPVKLRLVLSEKGFIIIISLTNPAIKPNTIFPPKRYLNTSNAIIATPMGIVEFNNAVIPPEKYCAPHTSKPWPPKIINIPSIKASFH